MTDVSRCPSCGQANRVPNLQSGQKAVCGRCKSPLAPGDGHPVALTDDNFHNQIAVPAAVVDFWAAWCGPCRMIAPIVEQLASEYRHIRFGKLNVDENPRSAASFGVQGIPLLIFFKNGVESGRVVGAVPRSRIESAIAQYLG